MGKWEQAFTRKIWEGGQYYTFDAPLGKPAIFWKKDGKWADFFREKL